jgi:inner membrane protein
VDNLTHTLVGAALAEAGLKKRTALGAATLMIGANFPDIDVAFLALPGSIDLRRGITHGFPALAILPFALAGIMLLYDKHVRRRRDPSAIPADFRQLALLSALSIWTHPTLDFMNIYGMRWLMPMVNRWFYADALFIVDLWILLGLGIGVWISRRKASVTPARVALVALASYVLAMIGVTSVGRAQVGADYPGRKLMLAPVPLVPWNRNVVLEDGDRYRIGSWTPGGGYELTYDIPRGDMGDHRESVALARQHLDARPFLRWSRFPYYEVSRQGSGTVVQMYDARYPGVTWASSTVRLP